VSAIRATWPTPKLPTRCRWADMMTGPDADNDWDGWDDATYDDDPDCSFCGGDGEEECADPIQCFTPRCNGEWHQCPACRGSGLARDQRIW
jgi:hypothetical protein